MIFTFQESTEKSNIPAGVNIFKTSGARIQKKGENSSKKASKRAKKPFEKFLENRGSLEIKTDDNFKGKIKWDNLEREF